MKNPIKPFQHSHAMIQRPWRASESRIQILPLQDSLTYARKVNFNHNGMLRNIIMDSYFSDSDCQSKVK